MSETQLTEEKISIEESKGKTDARRGHYRSLPPLNDTSVREAARKAEEAKIESEEAAKGDKK